MTTDFALGTTLLIANSAIALADYLNGGVVWPYLIATGVGQILVLIFHRKPAPKFIPAAPKPAGRSLAPIFGKNVAGKLVGGGLSNLESLSQASDEALAGLGFTPIQIKHIREDVADNL